MINAIVGGAGTTAGKSRGNAGARGRVVLSKEWVWGVPQREGSI